MTPEKTGRNDPCPCGSGKKYKKCCLKLDRTLNAPGALDRDSIMESMRQMQDRFAKQRVREGEVREEVARRGFPAIFEELRTLGATHPEEDLEELFASDRTGASEIELSTELRGLGKDERRDWSFVKEGVAAELIKLYARRAHPDIALWSDISDRLDEAYNLAFAQDVSSAAMRVHHLTKFWETMFEVMPDETEHGLIEDLRGVELSFDVNLNHCLDDFELAMSEHEAPPARALAVRARMAKLLYAEPRYTE